MRWGLVSREGVAGARRSGGRIADGWEVSLVSLEGCRWWRGRWYHPGFIFESDLHTDHAPPRRCEGDGDNHELCNCNF